MASPLDSARCAAASSSARIRGTSDAHFAHSTGLQQGGRQRRLLAELATVLQVVFGSETVAY